jgi:RND family efflux transporter MFP subunit
MKVAKSPRLWIAGAAGLGAIAWMSSAILSPGTPVTEARAQQSGGNAGANNAAQNRPPVNVRVDKAERGAMPFLTEAVGTVQPIASVAIRSRIDAQIESILVPDGAAVKAGDILVKLDSRQIEAQIKQAEATLAKDRATLEQAERDVARFTELVSRQTGTQVSLDNAKTTAAAARAAIMGDQAQIENLNVQLSWYTIKAPIAGRVGTFTQKAGNIIRSGDATATGTLTTIVQTTPIYVSFSVPQRLLGDLREAAARKDSEIIATPQGATKSVNGKLAVIDNAIDPATGTITVRGVFDNPDEVLWAGQLCSVRIQLRVDPDVVSVPRVAVQSGQNGNYVYIIEEGVARIRPVELGRFQENRQIISKGLNGNETVVTDGALALVNGARVEVRGAEAKKGNS